MSILAYTEGLAVMFILLIEVLNSEPGPASAVLPSGDFLSDEIFEGGSWACSSGASTLSLSGGATSYSYSDINCY
jgi:hypothetical protein